MKHFLRISFAVLIAGNAACDRSEPRTGELPAKQPPPAPAAPADTSMGGMKGMQGMGGMQAQELVAQMRTHMQAMHGASGDSLKAMLPMHRQMAANMLAEMNREMRQMNMVADPAWTATADSLRQDLVRLPEMGAAELQAAMPAHKARLDRLMGMHQAMMDAGH